MAESTSGVGVPAPAFDTPSEWKRRALAAEAALRDIADDYADRFDLDSPSTNPGMKSVVKQARAVLDAAGVGASDSKTEDKNG